MLAISTLPTISCTNLPWKSQFLSGLMQPIMNFVGNLGYVAVAVAGQYLCCRRRHHHRRHPGVHPVRAKTSPSPSSRLAQVSNMLQSMAAAPERVFEFLGEEEEDQPADPACRADPTAIDGQVTFDHVRFGYTPEKTVIHDFSAARSGPARRWPSWAPPAQARPPWSSC